MRAAGCTAAKVLRVRELASIGCACVVRARPVRLHEVGHYFPATPRPAGLHVADQVIRGHILNSPTLFTPDKPARGPDRGGAAAHLQSGRRGAVRAEVHAQKAVQLVRRGRTSDTPGNNKPGRPALRGLLSKRVCGGIRQDMAAERLSGERLSDPEFAVAIELVREAVERDPAVVVAHDGR
jgi:hypothetical protein